MSLAVGLSSCHKMPLTAPSGTAINLVASTNVLAVNGSTDVTAVLIEGGLISSTTPGGGTTPTTSSSGTPVQNGTVVTFTTSLGRIEPAQAQTTGGKTTVKLIADGRSGTATITAFSGAATKTLDVKVGAAAAARVLVTATPSTLPALGGTATIAAIVQDQQGNGLAGVPVSFGTDVGSLGAAAALTDNSGTATTTLTTTTGPATVTANAGGGTTGTLSATVKVTLKSRNLPTLKGPTGTISESAPQTFTVGLATGSVVTNVRLDMGDGTTFDLGPITTDTTVQYMYGDDGAFTVTATATDIDGIASSTAIGIVVVPITATGSVSPAAPTTGAAVTFTITVGGTGVAIDHYVFDFGDGTVISTTSSSLAHVFTTPGVKTVNVSVVPAKGHTKTVPIVVVVS